VAVFGSTLSVLERCDGLARHEQMGGFSRRFLRPVKKIVELVAHVG
jgi:hypothetical protein